MGDASLFEAAWTDARAAIREGGGEACTNGLIALARGATSLGRWDDAHAAATAALGQAQSRGEAKSIELAEATLAANKAARLVEGRTADTAGHADDCQVDPFAHDLLGALEALLPKVDELSALLHAALGRPQDLESAYALARGLREAAEYERAGAWFGRALRLAQDAGDNRAAARCLGGLGNLHVLRGDFELATAYHRKHLELARIAGLQDMEGLALTDLCAVSFTMNDGAAGFAYAQDALAALGPGHSSLPRLAHDVAAFLMEQRGDFENALVLFRSLQRVEFPDSERLLFVGAFARAAAGAGHVNLFEEAWTELWSAMERKPIGECHAGALIQLAEGALLRGAYELAENAARRAHAIATTRGEVQIAAVAASVTSKILNAAATRARVAASIDPAHDRRTARRLARGIATALLPLALRSAEDRWRVGTDQRV
jgi:tetratricopeptide (TPR) repeat protein